MPLGPFDSGRWNENDAAHPLSEGQNGEGEKAASFVVSTAEVLQAIVSLAREEGFDSERVSVRKVGRILSQMRLSREPRPGGKGSHRWRVPYADLERWRAAYALGAQGDTHPD